MLGKFLQNTQKQAGITERYDQKQYLKNQWRIGVAAF